RCPRCGPARWTAAPAPTTLPPQVMSCVAPDLAHLDAPLAQDDHFQHQALGPSARSLIAAVGRAERIMRLPLSLSFLFSVPAVLAAQSGWANVAVNVETRAGAAVAFDAARGRVVLFGGAYAGALGDTWEFGGAGWATVATAAAPVARSFAALAYDL